MSLPRVPLVVALLAMLLNGGAAWADPPATEAPAAAAVQPAADPAPVVAPQSPATSQSATPSSSAAPALAPQQPLTRAAAPVSGSSTSGMVSGLIFLLVLVLGAAWLIKRTGNMPALRGGSSMKVVAALSLGPRERVVLIELGGQQWLLGVGTGSVTTLHHFEQPIIVGGGDDFAGKLRQLWPQGVGSQGQSK
jgi:flagellar biosynthetic protein FliO